MCHDTDHLTGLHMNPTEYGHSNMINRDSKKKKWILSDVDMEMMV